MIPVTKPFLPPIGDYQNYVSDIFGKQWLTNMGPLATMLETKLKAHLGLNELLFVTNGTVALQMAIRALNLEGEIITTPFSFVATTSCIVWENCAPVFVDIDPLTLNIDASKIEAAITNKTSAILATHVYGNPCDVQAIEKIANKHNLKVIYDGAHAFGVQVNGKSIFEYGDISTCSLHATKLYHSVEGGLVASKHPNLLKKMASIRNFGISGFDSFAELGINAKNSEFHAAMGLVNLDYIKAIHEKRKVLSEEYDKCLKSVSASIPQWHSEATKNYAYYPIVLESEPFLLKLKDELEKFEVHTRRYFYPSLASALPYLQSQYFSVTEDVSKRILCLPLYYDLTLEEVQMISQIISKLWSSTFSIQ